jgi:hypothetical protein
MGRFREKVCEVAEWTEPAVNGLLWHAFTNSVVNLWVT